MNDKTKHREQERILKAWRNHPLPLHREVDAEGLNYALEKEDDIELINLLWNPKANLRGWVETIENKERVKFKGYTAETLGVVELKKIERYEDDVGSKILEIDFSFMTILTVVSDTPSNSVKEGKVEVDGKAHGVYINLFGDLFLLDSEYGDLDIYLDLVDDYRNQHNNNYSFA